MVVDEAHLNLKKGGKGKRDLKNLMQDINVGEFSTCKERGWRALEGEYLLRFTNEDSLMENV